MGKRNAEIYKDNPFVTETKELVGTRVIAQSEDRALIDNAEDEVEGTRTFMARKPMEKDEFVKLYSEAIGAILSLNKAGQKVFAIICENSYDADGNGKMTVDLKYDILSDKQKDSIKQATFFRGINECISAGVIAQSMLTFRYHVNPSYLFSGERLAILRLYECKDSLNIPRKASAVQ